MFIASLLTFQTVFTELNMSMVILLTVYKSENSSVIIDRNFLYRRRGLSTATLSMLVNVQWCSQRSSTLSTKVLCLAPLRQQKLSLPSQSCFSQKM